MTIFQIHLLAAKQSLCIVKETFKLSQFALFLFIITVSYALLSFSFVVIDAKSSFFSHPFLTMTEIWWYLSSLWNSLFRLLSFPVSKDLSWVPAVYLRLHAWVDELCVCVFSLLNMRVFGEIACLWVCNIESLCRLAKYIYSVPSACQTVILKSWTNKKDSQNSIEHTSLKMQFVCGKGCLISSLLCYVQAMT